MNYKVIVQITKFLVKIGMHTPKELGKLDTHTYIYQFRDKTFDFPYISGHFKYIAK